MLEKLNCYVARVGAFLITAALIMGMVGCAPVQHNLTTSSTEGGEVTTPGEDTFTYNEGTVVDLVATPEAGYRFVKWTGDVDTIANVNAAITTITMDGDYSILANFGLEIWEIRNWYDLDAIRDDLSGPCVLMNNLDSTTAGYTELASPTANQGTTLSNSYSKCSVTGNSSVGGLVGDNWYYEGIISNSYSTGRVTGSSQVGGLVGYNTNAVSNSFWDRVTSGMEESDGGTGKTTAEMKSITTFSRAGWNIITVANTVMRNPAYTWNIIDKQTYPFFGWQS